MDDVPFVEDEADLSGWRQALVGSICWYASRTLFLITLVAVAHFLKTPLDELLTKLRLTDTQTTVRQETIQRVSIMLSICDGARMAVERTDDLLRLASGPDSPLSYLSRTEFEFQKDSVRAHLESLRATVLNRPVPVPPEFAAIAFDIIDEVQRASVEAGAYLEAAKTGGARDTRTFQVTRALLRSYLQRLESLAVLERARLSE